MMIEKALKKYSLTNPQTEMIRHNENETYKIVDQYNSYVLRIHKPIEGFTLGILQDGFSKHDLLREEMSILAFLHEDTNIAVQKPITNKSGEYITVLDHKTLATLLSWVEGVTVDTIDHTCEIMTGIGEMTAKMHLGLKKFQNERPEACIRYSYQKPLLEKIAKQVRLAEQSAQITCKQAKCMIAAIKEIAARMTELDALTDTKGLVHTDLSPSNMICSKGEIIPIDFSLSGYSYYYMDIGSLFSHFTETKDQYMILTGYERVTGHKMQSYFIEPFIAMQVLLYIACQHNRASKQEWFSGAVERWCETIFNPLVKK